MTELPRKITDDPYGAAILIRRLVMEQGAAYWRRYLLAFFLMAVSAAATAGSAYLLGEVINQAYVDKNVRGIAILSLVTIAVFTLKGAATYGHSVILSQISNAILANNQRRLFSKLMSESVGFFSERHSSEFLARLTAGATSVTQVLNLLINAVGRDVLSLIALVCVMLMQDPYMALLGFLVAPPAMLVLRKLVKRIKGLAHNQFTGTADIMETMQESLQGIRTVKAFTLEADHARAHRRQHRCGRAQRQQDGAGLQPRQPADGDARRLRDRGRTDVWRLSRGRDGRDARAVLLVPDRVPAGL